MDKKIKERIAAINSGIIPEGYKKTKVGIVPWGWEVIKAKEVFSNISNKKHNGDLEVLSSTQDKGIIPRSMLDIDIKYDKESTSNYKKVEKGNFVISLRSFQGGIEYSEYEGLISPAYTVLGSKVEICDDYYKSYLKSPDYIQRLNTAVYGIRDGKNISYDDFSLIYILFPPLPEQQKIAEILYTQDKLIELQEKKIEQLKELKKAYLQKMFPKKGCKYPELRFKGFTDAWEQHKLGECAEFNPKSDLPDIFEYVDLESVVGTDILSHRTESKSSAPSRAQRLAQKGDVFYQTVRPYQKNNCIFENDENNWVFSTGYAQLRPVNDGYFLLTLLQNEDFVKLVLDSCTGTSYPAINSNDLADIDVNIPINNLEQQRIGDYFRNLDSLITLHQRKSEQEKQKKKALMQLLLTGIVRTK